MRSYLGFLVASATIAVAACTAQAVSSANLSGSDILGGSPDSSDSAVIALALLDDSGKLADEQCTAELLSPTVLLTAAHCVFDITQGAESDPSAESIPTMSAVIGSSVFDPNARVVPIRNANLHPHPAFNEISNSNDIAIIVLDTPITDIQPLPINTKALDKSIVGQTVQLIGYGVSDDAGDAQNKNQISATIRDIDGTMMLIGNTGAQTCFGDSGGPAIMKIGGVDTIIGIDDYGNSPDDNCQSGDYFQSVDKYTSFINRYLQDGGASQAADAGVPAKAEDLAAACTSDMGSGAACDSCMSQHCCAPINAAAADSDWVAFTNCANACPESSYTCTANCGFNHQHGATIDQDINTCSDLNCSDECGGDDGGADAGSN